MSLVDVEQLHEIAEVEFVDISVSNQTEATSEGKASVGFLR